jgi:4-oxalocrotonate tautomerase
MPIVQIELMEGRTIDQKREVAHKFVEVLTEVIHCKKEDIRIIFREMKPENYVLNGELRID